MTSKIVLDRTALEALFPEGSEIRVELQKHVLAQFIHQTIKPGAVGEDVAKMVDKARDAAVKEAVVEMGARSINNTIVLSQQLKDGLAAAARSAVADAQSKAIMAAAEDSAIRVRTALHNLVEAEVNRQIRAGVARELAAKATKAFKAITG